MLRGALGTFTLSTTLASLLLIPSKSEARPGHRHRHRGHHGFFLSYGPGYYPYPAIGVGTAYFPFSIGFAFGAGPKDDRPSVGFRVRPKHTEVFVDGYYAGIVDDFSGSKRLRLDPAPHEITLYLDGHRVHNQFVNPSPGDVVRIRHDMEPLVPGEPTPGRPSPGTPSMAGPPPPAAVTAPPPPAPSPAPPSREFARLAVRAQPSDVLLKIDGELWSFPPATDSLTLHLPAGRYRVEIEKEGFETFRTQVDLAPGESTDLNVQLGVAPR